MEENKKERKMGVEIYLPETVVSPVKGGGLGHPFFLYLQTYWFFVAVHLEISTRQCRSPAELVLI